MLALIMIATDSSIFFGKSITEKPAILGLSSPYTLAFVLGVLIPSGAKCPWNTQEVRNVCIVIPLVELFLPRGVGTVCLNNEQPSLHFVPPLPSCLCHVIDFLRHYIFRSRMSPLAPFCWPSEIQQLVEGAW